MSKIVQDRFSITDVEPAILKELIEDRVHDIHTAHPAEVISYNNGQFNQDSFNRELRTVTVRLGVRRDVRGLAEKITPLFNVPVLFPSTNRFGMTWPINEGDTGLVVFSETSIDRWISSEGGTVENPRDLRMHDYSDGFFIPHVMQFGRSQDYDIIQEGQVCVFSKNGNNSSKLTLDEDGEACLISTGNNSSKVTLNPDGSFIITSNNDIGTTTIEIDNQGRFCIDTPLGSFTTNLIDALDIINASPAVGGAATAQVALLQQMIC